MSTDQLREAAQVARLKAYGLASPAFASKLADMLDYEADLCDECEMAASHIAEDLARLILNGGAS